MLYREERFSVFRRTASFEPEERPDLTSIVYWLIAKRPCDTRVYNLSTHFSSQGICLGEDGANSICSLVRGNIFVPYRAETRIGVPAVACRSPEIRSQISKRHRYRAMQKMATFGSLPCQLSFIILKRNLEKCATTELWTYNSKYWTKSCRRYKKKFEWW